MTMFIKLKNDWNGHQAGDIIFADDVDMARRLFDLAVAQSPTYAEVEEKVLSDYENKMKTDYHKKQVTCIQTNQKPSGPPQRKRGRPRKQKQ